MYQYDEMFSGFMNKHNKSGHVLKKHEVNEYKNTTSEASWVKHWLFKL